MSREIKFRAWKKENSPEMIHVVSSIDWANKEISFRCRLNSWTFRDDKESLDNIILMQYTGLKDKNGVEIYEGDYLKNHKKDMLEVVFEKGQFLFEHKTGRYAEKGWAFKYDAIATGDELEVIGNTYENPELLEVK